MLRRVYRWCDTNLHRYLTSALLLLGILYAMIAQLPKQVDML